MRRPSACPTYLAKVRQADGEPAGIAVVRFVVVLCVLALVSVSCGDDLGDSAESQTESATTVVYTPIPTDHEPIASEGAWNRWSLDPSVFGTGTVADVAGNGGTLVAVGRVGREDCEGCGASAWVSDNGVEWIKTYTDPRPNSRMGAVAAGAEGYVAVGDYMMADYNSAGTVWTSPDGLEWTSAELTEFADASILWDVTAGGPGFVAVGGTYVEHDESVLYPDSEERGFSAMVWTSADGVEWNRVEHDPGLFYHANITTVIATADGLVAVGSSPEFVEVDEDGFGWMVYSLGVWTSTDGSKWNKEASGVEPWEGTVWDAVAIGDTYLIAADTGIWHGTDLTKWHQSSPAQAMSLSVADTGFAAAVHSLVGVPILQSDDGSNWLPITENPSVLFTTEQMINVDTIRPGGPGLIAFGTDWHGSHDSTIELWTWSRDTQS